MHQLDEPTLELGHGGWDSGIVDSSFPERALVSTEGAATSVALG